MKIKRGLHFKFVSSITFLIILVAASISGFFFNYQKTLLTDSLIKRGLSLAKNLAYNCEYGVLIADKTILSKLIDGILKEPDLIYASIQDKRGEILSQRKLNKIDIPEYKKPIQPINKYSVNFSLSSGQKICQILVPISIQTDKKEIEMEEMMFIDKAESEKKITEVIGLVHIGLSLKKMDFLLVQITKKIGLITICIIIIGIGGAILLISAIVKPIRTLIDEARKIAKGNLNRQVPIYSHDEIGELSSAFNRMVKELQKSKKEMEHYNKTLEEKVEERTKKLKDAQSQLIQSAKMAAIGQLGASVAHELNNPLGGILGYAQHLLNKIKKTDFRVVDFKKCEKNLTYIEIEAQRCKEIVENLLIFSRKPVSPQKPLNLKLVLETTLFVLNHSLSSHNIKVISHVDPDLKKVIGDANQLQQVFTNIIINSQHAMQKEGTLTIIAQNKNKNEIEVSFSDTGCGISRENINKIFEPFFTTKQDHKGTGLGLSISYEIIKKHQGKIKVKSEIGKGTTFTIILAICKA